MAAQATQILAHSSQVLVAPANTHDRKTTTRNSKSLSGLAPQQLRTLSLLEKKTRSHESVAKVRVRHKTEQQPVMTKYYKTETPIYQAG
jgi:pre-60S factor REI1